MSPAPARVPVLAALRGAGVALFLCAACSSPPETSASVGGQTSSSSGGHGGQTSSATGGGGAGAGGSGGGTGESLCAVPPGAADTVQEGIPAKGLSCTRYPFPLASPRDVLETKDGAVFVTEFGAGRIVQLGNAGYSSIAEGLTAPIGLREDDDGSLLVTEEGLFSLARIDRATGARTLVAKLAHNVTYVARGPDGAAYVSSFAELADTKKGGVFRVDLGSGAITPFATGLNVPEGLFVSAEGRLFVAEWLLPSAVLRFESGGGPAASATVVAEGFQNVYGLADDGDGGFYAGDHAGKVVHVAKDGASTDVVTGIGKPGGIWIGANGDMWIAEFTGFGKTGYLIRIEGL